MMEFIGGILVTIALNVVLSSDVLKTWTLLYL